MGNSGLVFRPRRRFGPAAAESRRATAASARSRRFGRGVASACSQCTGASGARSSHSHSFRWSSVFSKQAAPHRAAAADRVRQVAARVDVPGWPAPQPWPVAAVHRVRPRQAVLRFGALVALAIVVVSARLSAHLAAVRRIRAPGTAEPYRRFVTRAVIGVLARIGAGSGTVSSAAHICSDD